jgi:hypothetical protein
MAGRLPAMKVERSVLVASLVVGALMLLVIGAVMGFVALLDPIP